MRRLLVLVAVLSIPGSLLAHSGGLNADGGHHDRKNGGYHCHRKPAAGTSVPQGAGETRSNLNRGPGAESVSYASCAEARAAGSAPLRAGDPGYSRRLDRDGDGVACE